MLSAIPAAMTLTSLVPMDYYNPVIPLFSPVPLSTLHNIKYDRLSPKAPACQQPGISLRPGYSPRLTFPLNLSINLLKNLNHHTFQLCTVHGNTIRFSLFENNRTRTFLPLLLYLINLLLLTIGTPCAVNGIYGFSSRLTRLSPTFYN